MISAHLRYRHPAPRSTEVWLGQTLVARYEHPHRGTWRAVMCLGDRITFVETSETMIRWRIRQTVDDVLNQPTNKETRNAQRT